MVIGDLNRFGFEVLSEDLSRELGDIFINVAGRRLNSIPVYLPTFVSELAGFMRNHESLPFREFDFSALSHEEAFALLHDVGSADKPHRTLTAGDVFNYYRMHSIDDAVDGWEIYVFEVADETHIVCQEISFDLKMNPLFSAVLPHKEFLATIRRLVDVCGQVS